MDYGILVSITLAVGGALIGGFGSYIAFRVGSAKDIEFIKYRLEKIEEMQNTLLEKLK